jgi:hypothetical protein
MLSKVEEIKLSDKYSLFKTKYNGPFTKHEFIKRVNQNESLYYDEFNRNINSLILHLDCDEFKSVDDYVLTLFDVKNIDKIGRASWIYTQIKEFKMEWMHTHEYLISSNQTNLKTQWTYVFYIQIPTNLTGNEGNIVFKTEDAVLHSFAPNENDIYIFSGDIPHMAIPTTNSDTKRIVYAANISFDLDNKIQNNKRIQFKDNIYSKFN